MHREKDSMFETDMPFLGDVQEDGVTRRGVRRGIDVGKKLVFVFKEFRI
jgi:hypothetical protein